MLHEKKSVTMSQRFYKLCLDPGILQLCILTRADISGIAREQAHLFSQQTIYIEQVWIFGQAGA